MRKDKDSALKLRRDNKSYNEITRILGIPKSTLATWFKKDELSQKTKKLLIKQSNEKSRNRIKTLIKINRIRWEKLRETAHQEAKKDFSFLIKNPLFVAGVSLYWAEGDSKIGNPFRLSNTDPKMISLYVNFLIRVLNIPKENLRAALILYPDLFEEKCIKFWAKIIGIPKSQFYKTQFIKGSHPTKRLSNGICMIICGNRQSKEKIMVWIDLLSKTL